MHKKNPGVITHDPTHRFGKFVCCCCASAAVAMQDIALLREQLRTVQAKRPTATLSEQCAVDVLRVLQRRGRVSLIHTRTRELITPMCLDRELTSLLAARGGRVSLREIPDLLGVAPTAAAASARRVADANESVVVAKDADALLSCEYLARTRDELHEWVAERG